MVPYEIVAYHLDTQVATTVSNAAPYDNRDPIVSPDGSVIVWVSQNGITGSQIWEAVQSAGGWSASIVATSDSPYSTVDTDGQVIVYDALRTKDGQTTRGIYWQPIGGGQEQEVPFPTGAQFLDNPHVSGGLISFENLVSTSGNNVWVDTLSTQTLYQVPTLSAGSDISVTSDGVARVVGIASNVVYGFVFQVPANPTPTPTPTPADTTRPVLVLPANMSVDATSPQGATVTYTVTATDPDNASSQLTLTCSPASGTTFAIGTTTVNCQASDPAGNQSSGSFQVVVNGASAQISNLINQVTSFNLKQGIQNSLDSKLQSVQASLADVNVGHITDACNQMAAFINETEAQSGKALTVDQANQLIAAANQIQAVLGC